MNDKKKGVISITIDYSKELARFKKDVSDTIQSVQAEFNKLQKNPSSNIGESVSDEMKQLKKEMLSMKNDIDNISLNFVDIEDFEKLKDKFQNLNDRMTEFKQIAKDRNFKNDNIFKSIDDSVSKLTLDIEQMQNALSSSKKKIASNKQTNQIEGLINKKESFQKLSNDSKKEGEVITDAATSEIESIKKIEDEIDVLISKINSIGTTTGTPIKDILNEISNSLATINGLTSVSGVFGSILNVAGSSDKISGLKDVLEEIAKSLEQIDNNASGDGFLKQLSSLTAQKDELETLLKLAQNVNNVNVISKNINNGGNNTDQQLINQYYDERNKALRDQIKYLKKLENQSLSANKRQKYTDLLSDAEARENTAKTNIGVVNNGKAQAISPTGNRSDKTKELEEQVIIQKELNSISEQDTKNKAAEVKANQDVVNSYNELIDTLKKLQDLKNKRSKTDDPAQQAIYDADINSIDEQKLRNAVQAALSNKSVTGDFSKYQSIVDSIDAEIARIEALAKAKINSANTALKNNQADTKQILQEDENEWKRAMDLLTSNSYFQKAIQDGNEYYDLLNNIVSIERTIRTDNKTGQSAVSYRFSDTDGNKLTLGADGSLEIERKELLDLADSYEIVSKAQNELNVNRKKLAAESSTQTNLYNQLKTQLDNLYNFVGKGNDVFSFKPQTKQQTKDFQDLTSSIAKTIAQINNLTTAEKGTTQTQIDKFLRKVYNWMEQNSKGANIFATELQGLIDETNNLGADVDINKQMGKLLAIQNAVSSQGATGATFFEEFKKNAKLSLSNLLAQYLSIQDIIRYVQSAISQINSLDYALVDLSKTADMTESQLDDFYLSASKSAKELGTTTEDIINLASSWSRLGFNTNEEATKMAELTAKFAAISPGMTTEEASTGLINIQKAWQKTLQVQDLETEVLDKVNTLGKLLPKHMVTYGALCA